MPFHERGGIRYFTFETFGEGVVHGVFTRRAGISRPPWDSLNVGASVGDDPAHVAENRARIFAVLGRETASMHDTWLVHGTDVVHAEAPRASGGHPPKADILFTRNPSVTLFMRYADCVPILLYDPVRRVAGIAHAGWQGTLAGVGPASVAAMVDRYGSQPADIRAAIGPSIGPDHYEVGPDVIREVRRVFGREADDCLRDISGRTHLDLWTANRIQLLAVGVEQVEESRICTACHPEDWFSHRAEKGRTGRFGALIALSP